MSFVLMKRAAEVKLPLAPKMVLMILADYANNDGTCFPSFATLAEKCGITSRSVMQQIKKLEEMKLIEVTRSHQEVNHYRVCLEESSKEWQANRIGKSQMPSVPQKHQLEHSEDVNVVHSPSERRSPPLRTSFTPHVNDVHPNISYNKSENQREREKELFDIFPKKDSEKVCLVAIRESILKTGDVNEITEKVERCVKGIQKAPGGIGNRFVPNALRFWTEEQWRNPEVFESRWKPLSKSRFEPEPNVIYI